MKASLVVLLLSLAIHPPSVVEATWSIVAIDKRTDRIGAAMATCLDGDPGEFPEQAADLLAYGFSAEPYHGGIIAQAKVQDGTGPAATAGGAALEGGMPSARTVVDAMTDPRADPGNGTYAVRGGGSRSTYPDYELRQYGVVTYDRADPVAAHTGPKLAELYGAFGFADTEETAATGATEECVVSVQGNIVYPGTVDAAHRAFVDGAEFGGEDRFPERLLYALRAGYEATGGDVRCARDPRLKGAILAFLKVVEPGDGGRPIDLEARFGGCEGRSALDAIGEGLAKWREDRTDGPTDGPTVGPTVGPTNGPTPGPEAAATPRDPSPAASGASPPVPTGDPGASGPAASPSPSPPVPGSGSGVAAADRPSAGAAAAGTTATGIALAIIVAGAAL